jgi:hypothetical protein
MSYNLSIKLPIVISDRREYMIKLESEAWFNVDLREGVRALQWLARWVNTG